MPLASGRERPGFTGQPGCLVQRRGFAGPAHCAEAGSTKASAPSKGYLWALVETGCRLGGNRMELEARLRRVEAAEEIRHLKARYCDLCDDGYPAAELCALFTDAGVWDGEEMGVFEGQEDLHRFFSNMPNVMSFAIHHVTNAAIAVAPDAETARGRWYLLQAATLRENNKAIWLGARYDDQFVRVEGKWKFRRVELRSRFYTSYEKGWADLPHLLGASP